MAEHRFTVPDDINNEFAALASHYGGVDKFMRNLVKRELEAKANLRREIQKGLDSGISDRSMDEIREEARAELGL